jgi:putative SOS response-associated peptidase YedK
LINARSETAANLPTWRGALQTGRCLIGSGGFFEWEKSGRPKRKYLFSLPGESYLFMDGLHRDFSEPGGVWPRRFAILTTEANSSIASIHNRMPVVVRTLEFVRWFSEDFGAIFDRQDVVCQSQQMT